MYLIIFEDGNSNTLVEPSEADLDAASDGYCDIYHFFSGGIVRYLEGKWKPVEAYE